MGRRPAAVVMRSLMRLPRPCVGCRPVRAWMQDVRQCVAGTLQRGPRRQVDLQRIAPIGDRMQVRVGDGEVSGHQERLLGENRIHIIEALRKPRALRLFGRSGVSDRRAD